MNKEYHKFAVQKTRGQKKWRQVLSMDRKAFRVKRSRALAWAFQAIYDADWWNSVLQRDREAFTVLDVHGKAIEISRAQYEKFVDEAKSGRKQSIDDPDDF